MFKKPIALLARAATMLAMAAGFAGAGPAAPVQNAAPPLPRTESKPPKKRRRKPRFGSNRYRPHQGERECARRRGGADWEAFKAADRVRRGLPAVKVEG